MSLIVGAITEFRREYAFLSNFYACEVLHSSTVYPSAEHAYQASKTDDIAMRERIARLKTPTRAKSVGRGIKLEDGSFMAHRVETMHAIVYKKFVQNRKLAAKLLATEDRFIVEGNTWGDTFWGVTEEGRGLNHLGRILMDVREALR